MASTTFEIRIANLLLLRHLCGSNAALVTALSPTIKAVSLKGMFGGNTTITDEIARAIEETVYLPIGWMDRDNEGVIRMGTMDYEIHRRIATLPPKEKERLQSLISGKW